MDFICCVIMSSAQLSVETDTSSGEFVNLSAMVARKCMYSCLQ